MSTVLSALEVRQAEQDWAKDSKEGTWPLMLKAGQSFVRQFLDRLVSKRVLVVAGRGNNGGDGYCIARLLLQAGVRVDVLAPIGYPSPEIDAHRAYQECLATGVEPLEAWPETTYDVVIDALFGSGLSRALDRPVQVVIEQMNASGALVLGVDVPSGLNADTGQLMPCAVRCQATHSFISFKPGMLTGEGPQHCGLLTLDNLGMKLSSLSNYNPAVLHSLQRVGNTNKARHGRVRVVGGRLGMGGAAIIAAQAALSAGAGRVISHAEAEFISATLTRSPEIMTQPGLPDDVSGDHVWVLGPGLGRDSKAREQVARHLDQPGSTGVLDADALHLIPANRSDLSGWVMTPHEGEAAVLLHKDSDFVRNNRPQAARMLSEQYRTVVVLKGSGSLVAAPGSLWFGHPGHPAMATPGMGDCLAGMIGALLAQGVPPEQAALSAVNWHAQIGAELAENQQLVLATDIIDRLRLKAQG